MKTEKKLFPAPLPTNKTSFAFRRPETKPQNRYKGLFSGMPSRVHKISHPHVATLPPRSPVRGNWIPEILNTRSESPWRGKNMVITQVRHPEGHEKDDKDCFYKVFSSNVIITWEGHGWASNQQGIIIAKVWPQPQSFCLTDNNCGVVLEWIINTSIQSHDRATLTKNILTGTAVWLWALESETEMLTVHIESYRSFESEGMELNPSSNEIQKLLWFVQHVQRNSGGENEIERWGRMSE